MMLPSSFPPIHEVSSPQGRTTNDINKLLVKLAVDKDLATAVGILSASAICLVGQTFEVCRGRMGSCQRWMSSSARSFIFIQRYDILVSLRHVFKVLTVA